MSFHFKHQLEEDNARLKKENEGLRKLFSKSLVDHDGGTQEEALEYIDEKLKQIKEGE